jgi:hypothetical protein
LPLSVNLSPKPIAAPSEPMNSRRRMKKSFGVISDEGISRLS